MKQGKTLIELAKELTRIKETAKDYIVPIEKLQAESQNEKLTLSFTNGEKKNFSLNNWSANQLATYTDIPKTYFDRLRVENSTLLATNINHGLKQIQKQNTKSESRMLRTIDGNVRGFLSSRYRILDAYDMLETILPVIGQNQMEVISSELTEQRLFIKALSPKIQSEVQKGDVVQYGLVVSTSDVGSGSVRVEPLIYRLVCENGLIADTALRKYHVGRNQSEENIRELLSDKTKELSDTAFWMQVKDLVLASMRPENFEKQVNKLREAANMPITNFDLPQVVELTMRKTGLTGEEKKNSILSAIASGNEGAGLTQWGLINSITRAAQSDKFTYEESIEMERAAGSIIELTRKDWSLIAEKAA